MEMNWCYYFINLQQKAIFSKNWGGPEKDRFSGFFLNFFGFFQSFVFKVGPLLLFFLLSSTLSALLPLLSSLLPQ